ncbi:addiction module toxin RelE [Candidatus Woesearchaeota archaeon]|nr:addiction module toxin RelE [Candidatus Woesearchaeota archaeon]
MREYEIKPGLEKVLKRFFNKDKATYEAVMKKIEEVISSSYVEHYKNLRYDMKDLKRVHIGHFVLVFGYDKSKDFLSFIDFGHHDNIYKR